MCHWKCSPPCLNHDLVLSSSLQLLFLEPERRTLLYPYLLKHKWLVCDTNSLKKITARKEKKHDMRPSTPHCITVPQLGTAPKTNMFHLKMNPWKGDSFQRNP